MSRRDLLIYVLIAVFGVGGAAVVSAVTMAAGPATPYLLWVGLSAVFISVIGLIVMLVGGAPPIVAANGAVVQRQTLSHNGTYVAYLIVCIGVPSAGFAIVNVAKALKPEPLPYTLPHGLAALKGAIMGDLSGPVTFSAALIGKQEDVSGTIIAVHDNHEHTGGQATMTTAADRTQLLIAFDTSELGSFSPGDHIYARCRIESASMAALNLGSCKVISSDRWLSGR
jgi:hypothetical protein